MSVALNSLGVVGDAGGFRPNWQNIAQVRPFPVWGAGALAANAWRGFILACPIPFSAVRVGFCNGQATAANMGITSCYVQPIEDPTIAQPFTGTTSDGVGTRGPSGNQLVTFNSAGADSAYPSASGATTTLNLPAGPAAPIEGNFFYSDWYSMPNGAYPSKTNDGFYYLGIIIQANANGLPGWVSAQAGDMQAYVNAPEVIGSKSFHLRDAMDGNAGPAAFGTWNINGKVSLGTSAENLWCPSVDIMTPGRVINVACIGDSQLGGWDNGPGANRPTSDMLGGINRACLALSTPALPLLYQNCCRPGITQLGWNGSFLPGVGSATTTGNGVLSSAAVAGSPVLPTIQPDVVFFQYASANDNTFAPTAVTIQQGFYTAIEMARWCRRNGIIPIICTVPPAQGRYTGGFVYWKNPEDARNYFNNLLRQQANISSVFYLLDVDAVVSAGGTPASIIPQYAQSDGVHFSDAGNIAIAAAAQRLLGRVISGFSF